MKALETLNIFGIPFFNEKGRYRKIASLTTFMKPNPTQTGYGSLALLATLSTICLQLPESVQNVPIYLYI